VPVPFAPTLEPEVLPGQARIEAAIREMLSR
jgi:pyruvate/2-oxoglutarate/acetoin dehydrogenase E1 component